MDASVLVVDDEKNIRLAIAQVLVDLQLTVDMAMNGKEAMDRLAERAYDLVLLDLRMPGINGLDVLRSIRSSHLRTNVVIITAFGTVDSAVEAMKLGAVDFLQKPFSPRELRSLVERILARESLAAEEAASYDEHVEVAKRAIKMREFALATDQLRQAIAREPGRAEGFNLLGVLQEIDGDRAGALSNYRAALAIDPTYEPARANLHRVVTTGAGEVSLGDEHARPDGGVAEEPGDRGR